MTKTFSKQQATLKCKLCQLNFVHTSLLKRHVIKVHANIKLYKCSQCIKSFDTKNALGQHHLKLHCRKLQQFECFLCRQLFSNQFDVKRHVQCYHRKPWLCVFCHFPFRTEWLLNQHYEQCYDNSQRFDCFLCCRKFKTQRDLKNHRLLYHTKLWICAICHWSFHTQVLLNQHYKHNHKNVKLWKCQICRQFFGDSKLGTEHFINKHQRFDCLLCRREFTTLNILRLHAIKCHVETWNCPYCDQSFMASVQLNRHFEQCHDNIKTQIFNKHQNNKIYTANWLCPCCNQFFGDSMQLQQHFDQFHKVNGSM